MSQPAQESQKKTSGTINVRDLHYAIMTQEDRYDTAPVYSTPKYLAPTVNLGINPTVQTVPAYGDGITQELYTGINGGDLSLQIHSLPIEVAADIFGYIIDDNGTLLMSANTKTPYVALLFITDKGNGTATYNVLYKCKFAPPALTVDTKTETVAWQQPTMAGSFLTRGDNTVKKGNTALYLYRAQLDEEADSFDEATAESWFEEVYTPTVTP